MEQVWCAMMCTLEEAYSRTSPRSRRRQWRLQRRRQRHRVQDGVFKKYFNSGPTRQVFYLYSESWGIFEGFLKYFIQQCFVLQPLRFHCVGGCWDRTQDCCVFSINGSQKVHYILPLRHSALIEKFKTFCLCLCYFFHLLKVPSGQIGSAWESYHWIGLEKDINRHRFLIF